MLSDRLKSALSLVPSGSTCIDVGADHGYLSLALESQGNICYAVENKKGPYKSLLNHLKSYPELKVVPLLQDGISYLPKNVDSIIILGMGGITIRNILSANKSFPKQIKYLIVEPQSDFKETISYLLNLGYENDNGLFVFEKRYYPLLRFVKSSNKTLEEYTPAQLNFGPYPLKSQDTKLKEYLLTELGRLTNLNIEGQEHHQKEINFINQTLKDYF